MNPITRSRRRLVGPVIAAGLVGCVAMVLSMGASLSGFTAAITDTANSTSSGTLAVTQTTGVNTCKSYDATATCTTINLYGGGSLNAGGTQTVTTSFAATGTLGISSGSLTPGTCSSVSAGGTGSTTPGTPNTSASNLCSAVNVQVWQGAVTTGTKLYDGSAAAFSSALTLGAWSIASGQTYNFVISLPSAAATNAVQGQTITQSLAWSFNS